MFEACANGAAVAGKTVAAVVTNYIAFMALLAWVNATLSWIGGRVGYGELSFEVKIYCFMIIDIAEIILLEMYLRTDLSFTRDIVAKKYH